MLCVDKYKLTPSTKVCFASNFAFYVADTFTSVALLYVDGIDGACC